MIDKIVKSIKIASAQNGATPYLCGDFLKYEITGYDYFIAKKEIEFILKINDDFDIQKFYNNLKNILTINKEIINDQFLYHFISEKYSIKIFLRKSFKTNVLATQLFYSNIGFDLVFKNIINEKIECCNDEYKEQLKNKILEIVDFNDIDIYNIANRAGNFDNVTIHEGSFGISEKNIEFQNFERVFASYFPSSSVKFIINFKNQKEFINSIIDYTENKNLSLSENSLENIFNNSKLQLVDTYNTFYLNNLDGYEENQNSRIDNNIRILLDISGYSKEKTFIENVSLFSDAPSDFSLMAASPVDPCPYGRCPKCKPYYCNPKCCCLHAFDIIRETNFRCHDKTVISCNSDGTGFGTEPSQTFPLSCNKCRDACEHILGITPGFDYCKDFEATGETEGWWTIPRANWPCSCSCAQENPNAPNNCGLSCVTCSNLKCSSRPTITSHGCAYRINLSPGQGCCGQVVFNMIFVVTVSQAQDIPTKQTIAQISLELFNKYDVVRIGLLLENPPEFANPHSILLSTYDDFILELNPSSSAMTSTVYRDGITGSVRCADDPEIVSGVPYNFADINRVCEAVNKAEFAPGVHAVIMKLAPGPYSQDIVDKPPPVDHEIWQTAINQANDYIYAQNIFLDIHLAALYVINLRPAGLNQQYEYPSFKTYNIVGTDWHHVVDDLPDLYSSSCDCQDISPIPIRIDSPDCKCCPEGQNPPCDDDYTNTECISNLPSACFDIPIPICSAQIENPEFECTTAPSLALTVCGTTLVIDFDDPKYVCCDQLNRFYGTGCECPGTDECPDEACCGPQCFDICNEFSEYPIKTEEGKRIVSDIIWCDCWDKKNSININITPNCTDCCCPDGEEPGDRNFPCERLNDDDPACQDEMQSVCRRLLSENKCCSCLLANKNNCCECCILLNDGNCGEKTACFSEIKSQTIAALINCPSGPDGPGGGTGPGGGGPGDGGGPDDQPPTWEPPNLTCLKDSCISGTNCDTPESGCTSYRHPDTLILNNGIGLIAYEEELENKFSQIKIKQFKTSVKNKILPNRSFSFGRLEHLSRWTNNKAKIYFYENIPEHLIDGGTIESPKDLIAFKNGPLEKQTFPLTENPIQENANGRYFEFYINNNQKLTNSFEHSDAYNIQFFILDSEDTGRIGDATDTSTIGKDFIIDSSSTIDNFLQLPVHLHNGSEVPVAYPSIATAYNYSNYLENSHFVYLTYQALEEEKWNIYLRQIRLSEYNKDEQITNAITGGDIESLDDAGISNVTWKIICVNDSCLSTDDLFTNTRTIVLQAFTQDGREIINSPVLSGNWQVLCGGFPESHFSKNKVFVQLDHSVVTDKCLGFLEINQVSYNWKVGQEFVVQKDISTNQEFYNSVSLSDDVLALGEYEGQNYSTFTAYSSAINLNWYLKSSESTWSVMSDTAMLETFKGIDISEPIPVTNEEPGHCTKPKVKVNYNNDIFITYETTESELTRIKIIGSNIPQSLLPFGTTPKRDLDFDLSYFFTPENLLYNEYITDNTNISQLPDMFIDLNNIIHLTWQSNRDGRWEIYYANSNDNFTNKRITNFDSKSLKPKVTGDNNGRIFIVWHDDRFGNYEIMLAYYSGQRILPLSQQDPYLATIRNNYDHFTDIVPLKFINSNNSSICVDNITVNFYADIGLQDLVFSISQKKYPFAFDSENILTSTYTKTYDSFAWTTETQLGAGPGGTNWKILTGDEFDTQIIGAYLYSLVLEWEPFIVSDNVEISFSSNDIADSDGPYTDWVSVSGLAYVDDLSISPRLRGRYQKIKLRITYTSTVPSITLLTLNYNTQHLLCLLPDESNTLDFYLNPKTIEETGIPFPSLFDKNQTYFIDVVATDDNGTTFNFEQNSSVSCSECSSESITWDNKSCSANFIITNNNDEAYYYNFKIKFYFDKDKNKLIHEYVAEYENSDLSLFTIDNDINATSLWTPSGLKINKNISHILTFWPNLDSENGLLCGINYYVELETCSSADEIEKCQDFELLSSKTWQCNCNSNRWNGNIINDARTTTRWISSGSGYSDTRITHTSYNNFNPNIKIRSNNTGIIIYESNIKELNEIKYDENDYKIYSSVFFITPSNRMYASGTQAIDSNFDSLVYKSDMPICKNDEDVDCSNSNCNSCLNSIGEKIKDTLRGRNLSFDIDQFDSVFMACETIHKDVSIKCNQLLKNNKQSISVHNCGANPQDLFLQDSEQVTINSCLSENILNKVYNKNDNTYNKIFKQIKVKDNSVDYYVTQNGLVMPVVSYCKVDLYIICEPDTIAVRVRNSNQEWSEWYSLNVAESENSLSIYEWSLSSGSGIKNVEFQGATPAGVSLTKNLSIVADYRNISYSVRFYKSTENTAYPPDIPNISDDVIWAESNIINSYNNIPVASIRKFKVQNDIITTRTSDYIFVEIETDQKYLDLVSGLTDENVAPIFDVILQGHTSSYGNTTVVAEKNGKTVFRGYFIINESNNNYSDGLSYVVPYFVNDCSSVASSVTENSYSKDELNTFGTNNSKLISGDVFNKSRDKYGEIIYKLQIRPNEDPYLVFGNQDFWINGS